MTGFKGFTHLSVSPLSLRLHCLFIVYNWRVKNKPECLTIRIYVSFELHASVASASVVQ